MTIAVDMGRKATKTNKYCLVCSMQFCAHQLGKGLPLVCGPCVLFFSTLLPCGVSGKVWGRYTYSRKTDDYEKNRNIGNTSPDL